MAFSRRNRKPGAASSSEVVALYDEHAEGIFDWFYSRTYCAETAGDLTSETFAVLVQRYSQNPDFDGAPGAWLWGVARNMLRRYHETAGIESRARAKLRVGTPRPHDDYVDVDARLDAEQLGRHAMERIDLLGPALAGAVCARVLDDKPYELVAQELACSVGAARVRVSRALTILADAVELGDEVNS